MWRYAGLLWLMLAAISIVSLPPHVAEAQQASGVPGITYLEPYNLYSTWYTELSIQADMFTSIPGRGIVAASGFDSSFGGYSLEVLSIDNSSRAVYRSKYVVSGIPTALSSSGDSESYIAVGSDRGEAIVYNAQDGSVSYIQASRYSVKKLSIGVGGAGDPYLAALDSQGYLYLYRATRGGWAEVGPRESTAIYNYTRSMVLDISGTEVVSGGLRRVDPSLLLMIYSPPLLRVVFVIYNETGYPIYNATLTAYLVKPRAITGPVFQALSGEDGVAAMDLPLIDPFSTVYNVSITHPEYETINISVELNQNMLERAPIEYRVIMKSARGVITPIMRSVKLSYAVLLDASGTPESIRFGRSLLLPIEPLYIKLIKPDIVGTPWTYLGIIIGYYLGSQPVVMFTYFDRDLDLVPVNIQGRTEGYVWYTLPSIPLDRLWIGYDDSGRGVSVILGSGRVYYFLYDDQRGFHLAFWGIDIPGPVVAADYRNGVLIAIDGSGRLHINRVDPITSIECTRSGSYLGVPLGPGVGARVGLGDGYLGTSSRIYFIQALQSIASSRCSIELVKIYPRAVVVDIISNYSIIIDAGYIDIYEEGSLVARSLIVGGSSVLYLPRGSYIARVSSSTVEYTERLVVGGSAIELPGPSLYRVSLSLYYQSHESPYTEALARVPPGLTLSIDSRINVTTTEEPLELLLEGGEHVASLISGGVELAKARFTIDRSGNVNLVLRVNTATLNISIRAFETIETRIPVIPAETVSLRLLAEGPLLRGDLGAIKPGSPVTLPLGVYRIVVTSPFFYQEEVLVGITELGSLKSLEILLRPREIQARLLVVDEFGIPVPNASVTIIDRVSGKAIYSGVTSGDGVFIIPMVFFGDYLVLVETSNRSLYMDYNGILRIDRQDLVASINRTRQQVTIILVDPISDRLASPVRVLVYMYDKLMYSEELSNDNVIPNLSLPHGPAMIVIEPAGREAIYTGVEMAINITVGGGRIEVTLDRKIVEYVISVVNDLGEPVRGVSVVIKSLENPAVEFIQVTGSDGRTTFRIPSGLYEVRATAPGYERLETSLPAGEQSVVLRLQPTLLNLLSRYAVVYVVIGMVAAIIIVVKMARRYIERKAGEEAI